MTIITSETRNPTPNCNLDWRAHFKDYEGGDVQGFGATPELATEDLLEQNRCDTCGDIHYPEPVPYACKNGDDV
jgi:hypothetical protein